MTSVAPPLATNTAGPTVLIGYEPNLNCFAGFDIRKHKNFTAGSPSIQININTLHKALQDGLSFITKGNDEIAIGFRPDQFIAYVQYATNLHIHGTSAKIADMLTKAASLQPIPSEQIQALPKERQRIVGTVSRLSRDANFRQKIIAAYDRRCAVTRMQLRLIDAAHILPVEAPGSNDDVTNGVCLLPTYHRAYDRGLIYLDDSLFMRMNPDHETELTKLSLAGGIVTFKGHLNKRIHLPPDKHQWPDVGMVKRANKVRGIPNE
jgi:putative restriction endonuclease